VEHLQELARRIIVAAGILKLGGEDQPGAQL